MVDVAGVLGLILLVGAAFVVVSAWRMWRRLKASARVRVGVRTFHYWTAPPGPYRQAAELRRDLARNVTATSHAIAAVTAAGGSVGELPALARRLEQVSRTLDVELGLLASEPDARETVRLLPAARARVEDVARVGALVRRTASAGLGAQSAVVLPALIADVEREVTALAAGVEALLTSPDEQFARRLRRLA